MDKSGLIRSYPFFKKIEMIKFYPDKQVDDIVGWHWIETDTGAWDGPKMDWETSHKNAIEKYCKDYKLAIQAGGNQGMYPRLLSRIFDSVYTFEPETLNYQTLQLNCSKERNIFYEQAALGSEKGYAVVNVHSMQNTGMHTIEPTQVMRPDAVPMKKLNDLNIDGVDLIMLDLEGFEYQAILGANKLLEAYKPVVFVERASSDVRNFLARFGYVSACQSSMDEVFIAI